jgi:hypothetical protein
MKLSYSIMVCNESKDLYSLIAFLKRVKDVGDEINILIDTKHVTPKVLQVIDHFKNDVVTCERDFDGDFSAHRNFHIDKCSGDYIFMLDPDEMPKEKLIKNIKQVIIDSQAELIVIPRLNMCLGATDEWYKDHNFTVNELDWINWPDYQGRIFKKSENIKWSRGLHEVVTGYKKQITLEAHPQLAILHIKAVEKDNNRWTNGNYRVPESDNLYDSLM